MLKQNRGTIITQVALIAVLLFITVGFFLIRNKNKPSQAAPSIGSQPVALYTGGIAAGSAVGLATFYSNNAK
ncbi:MAG: hypothetical protein NTX89_01830 [Candidatus Omnitrophica bacterium]|nr:hypothetical protein [Candidatus Omnitrophota bacterium]